MVVYRPMPDAGKTNQLSIDTDPKDPDPKDPVNVVAHQVAFFNTRLPMTRKLIKDFSHMIAKISVYDLFSIFRDKYHMIFTIPW